MLQASGKPSLLERLRQLFADRRAWRAAAVSDRGAKPPLPLAPSISGARFSLVGLTELREQLGERWPALSERVHELAKAVIQRHLTRGDVFDTHGDDGYVILFTQLTQQQAEFKCRVIAKEIAGKLLGADWVGRSGGGVVFELPEAALAAPSFEVALNAAIARGRPIVAEAPAPPASPRSAPAPAADPPAPRPARPAAHVMKPIERERRGASYTPVWDFGVEALLRFRYNAPPAPASASPSVADDAKADIAALTQVMYDVGRLLQSGRRLPVICPVRLETAVRDAWRGQIARMLRAAPAPLRRLVALEVVVTEANEADWIGSLERVWGSMPGLPPLASVPLKAAAVPGRTSSLVTHLNLKLPDGFAASKTGIELMGAFVVKAERVGMTSGVLGLRTRAAALAATAAGFRQLSGPVIHADVTALGQAIHFDLMTLYRDLLPKSA